MRMKNIHDMILTMKQQQGPYRPNKRIFTVNRKNIVNVLHTSYLLFLLHRQDFRKPNFTPKKKQLKAPKTLKMSLKKTNICIFSLNLEKFTQAGFSKTKFYTQKNTIGDGGSTAL